MNAYDRINNLEILCVLDAANIWYKKDWGSTHTYTLLWPDGKTDTSFKVSAAKNIVKDFGGSDIKWWPFDFVGRYILKVDTQTNQWKLDTIAWFVEHWLIVDEALKKVFQKSLSKEALFKDFDNFLLGGYKEEVGKFLKTRGVSHDFIVRNQNEIGSIFKNVWYYSNYFTTEWITWKDEDTGEWMTKDPNDKAKSVSVLMFPCLDEEWNRVGMKIRRVDGKTIRGKKSDAPSWAKTGLWYDEEDLWKDISYIAEWETDRIILKILWYKWVVWNLGGVASHKTALKSLLFDSKKILCLYDIDSAGIAHKESLAEVFGRTVHQIDPPIRESKDWQKLTDINDLFRVGYDTKSKWDTIFKDMYPIGWRNKQQNSNSYRFLYLKWPLEYFDKEQNTIVAKEKIMNHVGITNKELFNMRRDKDISELQDTCYWYGGIEGYHNTMREELILNNPWTAEPKIHPHIKKLIENIGWGVEQNYNWLHKAILFKLTHVNNVHLPAVVLFGSWWSWKWTWVNLLSKLFWEENTIKGLKQKDLEWTHDPFAWDKLVVEFQELSSQNTAQDKRMLDRMKSMIGEEWITVRRMYRDTEPVRNIAWFQLSSNHWIPIQLDSKWSWNRRFTIIKTGDQMDEATAIEMNNVTFNNKQILLEYVAWLYENFPEVPKMNNIPALDNDDKRDLEDRVEWAWNLFFEWFELKFPHIRKISVGEKKKLLEVYRSETYDDDYNDPKYQAKNFDNNLSSKYTKKTLRINGKTVRWYHIRKTTYQEQMMIDNWEPPYFTEKSWGEEYSKLAKEMADRNILNW